MLHQNIEASVHDEHNSLLQHELFNSYHITLVNHSIWFTPYRENFA